VMRNGGAVQGDRRVLEGVGLPGFEPVLVGLERGGSAVLDRLVDAFELEPVGDPFALEAPIRQLHLVFGPLHRPGRDPHRRPGPFVPSLGLNDRGSVGDGHVGIGAMNRTELSLVTGLTGISLPCNARHDRSSRGWMLTGGSGRRTGVMGRSSGKGNSASWHLSYDEPPGGHGTGSLSTGDRHLPCEESLCDLEQNAVINVYCRTDRPWCADRHRGAQPPAPQPLLLPPCRYRTGGLEQVRLCPACRQ